MTDERRDNFWQRVRRVPIWVWALPCFALALVYWPATSVPEPVTFHYLVLRWFHALAWVVLGVSFLVRATGKIQLANRVAFLALPAYALFLLATIGLV